jgi:hypothetical protein
VGKEGRWVLDGSLWRKVGGAWESWDLPPLLTSPAVGPHTAKPRDRAPQKRRRRLGTDDKREERCRAQRKAHPRSPWRWRPVEQRLICIVPYICLRLLQRRSFFLSNLYCAHDANLNLSVLVRRRNAWYIE